MFFLLLWTLALCVFGCSNITWACNIIPKGYEFIFEISNFNSYFSDYLIDELVDIILKFYLRDWAIIFCISFMLLKNKSNNTIMSLGKIFQKTINDVGYKKKYLESFFSYSLEQMITSPTRSSDRTAAHNYNLLKNSSHKVSQSRTKNFHCEKNYNQNLIIVTRQWNITSSGGWNTTQKKTSKKHWKKIHFPDYLRYTCINATCSEWL